MLCLFVDERAVLCAMMEEKSLSFVSRRRVLGGDGGWMRCDEVKWLLKNSEKGLPLSYTQCRVLLVVIFSHDDDLYCLSLLIIIAIQWMSEQENHHRGRRGGEMKIHLKWARKKKQCLFFHAEWRRHYQASCRVFHSASDATRIIKAAQKASREPLNTSYRAHKIEIMILCFALSDFRVRHTAMQESFEHERTFSWHINGN